MSIKPRGCGHLFLLFGGAVVASACAHKTETEKIVEVSVPVTVPCVAGKRPVEPAPLKSQHPDWYDKSPKQKAELTAAQGLKRQSYGQELNAATGECQ